MSNNTAQYFNLPGVDVEDGLRKVRDNRLLYRKLLLEFYQDYHATLDTLENALAREDYPSAQSLTHRLKGAAGNFGARNLSRAAAQLDVALKNGAAPAALRQTFENAFEVVMAGLQGLVEEAAAQKNEAEPRQTDVAGLIPLLDELAQHLQKANPKAAKLLPSIEAALGSEHHARLAALQEEIEMFEFEAALEILSTLREDISL